MKKLVHVGTPEELLKRDTFCGTEVVAGHIPVAPVVWEGVMKHYGDNWINNDLYKVLLFAASDCKYRVTIEEIEE